MFHINFMLRRVIVVAAAFWLIDYPFFQLLTFMLTTLSSVIYMATA